MRTLGRTLKKCCLLIMSFSVGSVMGGDIYSNIGPDGEYRDTLQRYSVAGGYFYFDKDIDKEKKSSDLKIPKGDFIRALGGRLSKDQKQVVDGLLKAKKPAILIVDEEGEIEKGQAIVKNFLLDKIIPYVEKEQKKTRLDASFLPINYTIQVSYGEQLRFQGGGSQQVHTQSSNTESLEELLSTVCNQCRRNSFSGSCVFVGARILSKKGWQTIELLSDIDKSCPRKARGKRVPEGSQVVLASERNPRVVRQPRNPGKGAQQQRPQQNQNPRQQVGPGPRRVMPRVPERRGFFTPEEAHWRNVEDFFHRKPFGPTIKPPFYDPYPFRRRLGDPRNSNGFGREFRFEGSNGQGRYYQYEYRGTDFPRAFPGAPRVSEGQERRSSGRFVPRK